MTGVQALVRKTKEAYQIAFTFKGVECREIVLAPHSRASETACTRLRGEILNKIDKGTFNYADYFPESKRAVLFGHRPASAGDVLRKRLNAYRDRIEKTLERSTWRCYQRDIDNVIIPKWGERTAASLVPSELRDWIADMKLSLKRIRNLLLPLRAVLDEAVEDRIIPVNPLKLVILRKVVPIERRDSGYEPQPYTQAELRTLLERVPAPERWAFQLWAYTGLRTGELVGLRWPRVDLEAGQLSITETTTEYEDKPRTKTKAGIRTFTLLPAALEALEAMREHTQLGGDRVTINPRGLREDKAWDTNKLASVWDRAHRGTGIPRRNPYQLRHTFASQLLSQGENTAYIAKLLGHKTTEMVTRVYGRWVAEGERLGFDRPPRRYGMEPLWVAESTGT